MEYQAYILPSKRAKFFQHFLTATAEDVYLNKYTALSGNIDLTGTFFNMGMSEIAIPYDKTRSIIDFYLINYLRIKDNDKYYYYNVLNVIKQTQKIILFRLELDKYHTFFNNHGGDYAFQGYLKYSNTRCIADEAKLFTPPSKSNATETIIAANWTGGYIGIGCVKWSKGGFSIIVTDPESTVSLAANSISSLLKDGEIDVIVNPNSSTPSKSTEKFEIVSGYIVPEILIKPYYKDTLLYQHGAYKGYSFRETGKQSFTIPIQNYRTKIVEFGTFSSRINVGVNSKDIEANIELTASTISSDIDISLSIGTQKISLTNDFGFTLTISALTSYLSSNKISIALNTLSAVGGLAAGIATGNITSIIGSTKAGIDIGNDIFQQTQKPASEYGNGNAALTYGKLQKGIGMWIYSPENEYNLTEMKYLFGGDCQQLPISFEIMKERDKEKPTTAYNYYEFTKIVATSPQVNCIAPLLLGGVEIEFIE